MGIVIELQQEALYKDTDILSLLRKAYLVARKLHLKDFEAWINREMNGYGPDDEVPKYHIYRGEIKAWNPYHGWVPVICDRELPFTIYECRDSISNLIAILEKKQGAAIAFPNELNAYLSKNSNSPMPTKYQLQLSLNLIYGTLEAIRNRILDWAITLEENGIVGDGLQFTRDEIERAQNQTVNNITNVFGNITDSQIQQGSNHSTQERL